jgi:hypothetical protein
MPARLITLTTDFGAWSYYVSQMKGAILSRNPEVRIIDLSHEMRPFDVAAAAYWINRATRLFPPDSIHVVVVDPGVGTRRDLVYCRTKQRTFLAPDNGVLAEVLAEDGWEEAIRLANAQLFHADVSRTFHGRDILAPVAAKLSLGAAPRMLGEPIDRLGGTTGARAEIRGETIYGSIVFVDRFGNLISNIPRRLIEKGGKGVADWTVSLAEREIHGLAGTYGENQPGTLVALFDSDGYLEVAVVNGSAAASLSIASGQPIRLARRSP